MKAWHSEILNKMSLNRQVTWWILRQELLFLVQTALQGWCVGFVADCIRQAPINIIYIRSVQMTKKGLSPNHSDYLCLRNFFQFVNASFN